MWMFLKIISEKEVSSKIHVLKITLIVKSMSFLVNYSHVFLTYNHGNSK